MKTVVYGATKNIYRDTIPSIRSCLQHGNADEIVLLTEGKYPYDLPIKTIDVSGQTFFPKDGINATKRWTWMCLMKCAVTELFPDRDRIVFLDCDTIVEHDLDDLFEMEMDGCYYASVRQKDDGRCGEFTNGDYFNVGVLVCNLAKLRDGKEAEIRKSLNEKDWRFPEQDCINKLCEGQIKILAGRWNVSQFTEEDDYTFIRHYAAFPTWRTDTAYGMLYDDHSLR